MALIDAFFHYPALLIASRFRLTYCWVSAGAACSQPLARACTRASLRGTRSTQTQTGRLRWYATTMVVGATVVVLLLTLGA